MGLNETLDRLQRAREKNEATLKLADEIASFGEKAASSKLDPRVREYAERIFFQRMLKDINPGMGQPKIDALIDRSIMIATRLVTKLL